MNWDQIAGSWKEMKGRIQSEWGELTGDDMEEIQGDRTRLEGKIQQRYGKTKEEAREAVDEWLRRM
jgi:uncharacterized protein YjbJ (UPF0337 family)